jgi:Lantibiotic dehydratase, N terminus
MAVQHSPDLMVAGAEAGAGGQLTWVLGEVHPSVVTPRYASWVTFHDAPETLRAAIRHDLRGNVVWIAETAEDGGAPARLSNVLPSDGHLRLVFAHDSCGYGREMTMTVGECDLIGSPAGLRVRRRDGTFECSLFEAVGDLLSAAVSHGFSLVPSGAHAPRVTIDDLVVSRESWTFAATDPAFADTADESARYLQARAWASRHGLPRYVFVRFTGEPKPYYVDLTSLASIDLISRSARRTRRDAGPDATVTLVEMLPALDEAWLADARDQRFSAELRMVAVDQRAADLTMADQKQEA